MEREELLQQVNESLENDGKQLSSTLSEESINGELDDALEDITDDEEKNKVIVSKLAKRLLRMDGNLHSNVSREVKAYKKSHPVTERKPKEGEQDGSKDEEYEKLLARVAKMEQDQKDREEKDAKDAVISSVEKGLRAKFKSSDIEVNGYVLRQTLRDMEIEDVKDVDTDGLIRQVEKAYFKNLKEAGLDKKDTGPRYGQRGSKGESAADRFFAKKAKREGWKK